MTTLTTNPTIARSLHILSRANSLLAERAATALDTLLAGVYRSPWQEVAWSFSRLTGDGFPVEFTLTSLDTPTATEIRYTTEIAGPEVDETQRLSQAEQLLNQLGAPPIPEAVRAHLHQVQAEGTLRYGAWVGGRHCHQGDRYKLYVEVPRASSKVGDRWIRTLIGDSPLLPNRCPSLQMIGYDPNAARTEFYFRTQHIGVWEASLLLKRANLSAREPELFDWLNIGNLDSEESILTGISGFSFSVASNHEPMVLSLFADARSLLGSDAQIRQHLLALSQQRNWSFEHYAALTHALVGQRNWLTKHGILSFVVPAKGTLGLYISLRPPD